jgi:hypothetical protein
VGKKTSSQQEIIKTWDITSNELGSRPKKMVGVSHVEMISQR